jgi:hypothetical protein
MTNAAKLAQRLPAVACVVFIPFSYRDMREPASHTCDPAHLCYTAYRTNKYEQSLSPWLSKHKREQTFI